MLMVTQLPRQPFLPHSGELVRHLWPPDPGTGNLSILEIGCGSDSPLAPILSELRPAAFLYQIDAREEVVAAARRRNSTGKVERMSAADMSAIPDESIDMVVAMAVFDQNPASALPVIGRGIHRVLRKGGWFLYVHNEELNAPATSTSFASGVPPHCLLPSDRWHPRNDIEYCSVDPHEFMPALSGLGSEGHGLQQYVDAFYLRGGQRNSANGKRSVPIVRELDVARMREIRRIVRKVREGGVAMSDHRTSDLLASIVEHSLLGKTGLRVMSSGVFEIQKSVPWESIFRVRPDENCFVRGITKFGYSAQERPAANASARQEINVSPNVGPDEILLIAYQYGVLAKKEQATRLEGAS